MDFPLSSFITNYADLKRWFRAMVNHQNTNGGGFVRVTNNGESRYLKP